MSDTKLLLPIRNSNGTYDIFEAVPSEMDWPELRAIWTAKAVSMPLCFAPPEEKLDLFFFYACQAHQLPASQGTVFDPASTDALLAAGQHDCLVASATLASYFLENKLFAARLEQLKCLVFVGDLAPEDKLALREALEVESVVLAHPSKSLKVKQ